MLIPLGSIVAVEFGELRMVRACLAHAQNYRKVTFQVNAQDNHQERFYKQDTENSNWQMDIYQQDSKQRMDIYHQEGKKQMKIYQQDSKQQMHYLPKL